MTTKSSHLHSYLLEQGVRITDLSSASPERGYKKLKQTLGKTKVRSYYINNQVSFFKPLTPYGNKDECGMVNIDKAQGLKIESKCRKVLFERPGTILFTATREKPNKRQASKRRAGQNQLMGASCRDIFLAHCNDDLITIRGNDYHWPHLIAYFLGGEHSRKNIVPGTAASNYNTLELVEQFVAHQLIDEKVDEIKIKVEPYYNGDTLIPDELIFHLNWQKLGNNCFEKIHINPRSYQRVNGSIHNCIEFVRMNVTSPL
ncbi:DNA/RNA non-specific endonuclease [Fluoribacter gormanii]|uniref:DNA/RNA non-specific endonuclease n=1 Tax=Fluoribacter gormanii TaxID=464 RepID=UPI0013EF7B02|nr:DNA/RNA non-specific endonuclease [Fluoribacter gormanii]